LKSWLSQYREQSNHTLIDTLARKIAWELSNKDVSEAFRLLYLHHTPEIMGKITEQQFLERKFYTDPSSDTLKILPLKHWSKLVTVPSKAPISSLILLYEAALKEVKKSKAPALIQCEASETLSASFDQTLMGAIRVIQQRMNRLAALMLDPTSVDHPAMQLYWTAYQAYYNAGNLKSDIAYELDEQHEMRIPSLGESPVAVVLRSQANIQQLSEYRKNKTHELEYKKALSDRSACGDDKTFLAKRQKTRTSLGYTADPLSPANIYCAKIAWKIVGKTQTNPREQFWKLLYPHLQALYLGADDRDWPNYGEALLWGDKLVNYRKLALMAQHRDVHKIITGRNHQNVTDKILKLTLEAMPSFHRMTLSEFRSLEIFNSAQNDALFWQSSDKIHWNNACEFFQDVLSVLDQYRSSRNGNERLEHEMSFEGTQALSQYISTLHCSNLIEQLRAYKKKLHVNNQVIHSHLDYLIHFRTKMMSYDSSCFSAAYDNLLAALNDIGEFLRENIKLEKTDWIFWGGKIEGCDSLECAADDQKVINSCLEVIPNIESLIEWVKYEAGTKNSLSIGMIANKFIALAAKMSMTEIFNVVLSEFPNDGAVLFSDQVGQGDALAFTKHAFLQKLFPDGIDVSRLSSILDYTCAMKFHLEYGVKGKHQTINSAIAYLKYTDLNNMETNYNGLSQLLAFLISDSTSSQSDLFFITANIPADYLMSFIRFFDLESFPRFLPFLRQKMNKGLSQRESWGFDSPSQIKQACRDYVVFFLRCFDLEQASDLRKSVMIFNEFFHDIFDKNINLSDSDLQGFLRELPYCSELFNGFFIIWCLEARNHGVPEDESIASIMGSVLSLFKKGLRNIDLSSWLSNILYHVELPEELEIDMLACKVNEFRRLFRTIKSPEAVSHLLKESPESLYPILLSHEFSLSKHMKTFSELLIIFGKLKRFQREAIDFSHIEIPLFSSLSELIPVWGCLSSSIKKKILLISNESLKVHSTTELIYHYQRAPSCDDLLHDVLMQSHEIKGEDIPALVKIYLERQPEHDVLTGLNKIKHLIHEVEDASALVQMFSLSEYGGVVTSIEKSLILFEVLKVSQIHLIVQNVRFAPKILQDVLKLSLCAHQLNHKDIKSLPGFLESRSLNMKKYFIRSFKYTKHYVDAESFLQMLELLSDEMLELFFICKGIPQHDYSEPKVSGRVASIFFKVELENNKFDVIENHLQAIIRRRLLSPPNLIIFFLKRLSALTHEILLLCEESLPADYFFSVLLFFIKNKSIHPSREESDYSCSNPAALAKTAILIKKMSFRNRLILLRVLREEYPNFIDDFSPVDFFEFFANFTDSSSEFIALGPLTFPERSVLAAQVTHQTREILFQLLKSDTVNQEGLIRFAANNNLLVSCLTPQELVSGYLNSEESLSKKFLSGFSHVLARFKAIYQLLVKHSLGGRLFHAQGSGFLNNLSLDDLEGWRHFLSLPGTNESGSLRLLAWSFAIIPEQDRRVRNVEAALFTRRSSAHFYSGYHFLNQSNELVNAIKTACAGAASNGAAVPSTQFMNSDLLQLRGIQRYRQN
jgi:hypothetical protein